MSYLKLRSFIISLLKDESGTNAVEYALTMVFGAVFIIGGLLTLSPAIREPLTDVAVCLADAANCASGDTGGGNGGGNDDNRSGLGDGTNPGQGGGTGNSPNKGNNNPNNS